MSKDGRALQPQGRLLDRRIAPASEEAARGLGVQPRSPVLFLHRMAARRRRADRGRGHLAAA